MKPIGNEKIYTFSFLQTILIFFFSFELGGRLDFTIVEPPKKLLMSFVTTTSFLSFYFCRFFKDVVSQSLIPYFQPKNASSHSLIPQFRLNFVHSQSVIPQFLQSLKLCDCSPLNLGMCNGIFAAILNINLLTLVNKLILQFFQISARTSKCCCGIRQITTTI